MALDKAWQKEHDEIKAKFSVIDLSQEKLLGILDEWCEGFIGYGGELEQAYNQIRKLIQRKINKELVEERIDSIHDSSLVAKNIYAMLKELGIEVE